MYGSILHLIIYDIVSSPISCTIYGVKYKTYVAIYATICQEYGK